MTDGYKRLQDQALRRIIQQRREAATKKHSTGPEDPGRTVDEGVEMLVGEIHALLKGEVGFSMSEGDVEFCEGGTNHSLVVEIRGRRYEIEVRDVGPSGGQALKAMMGRLSSGE